MNSFRELPQEEGLGQASAAVHDWSPVPVLENEFNLPFRKMTVGKKQLIGLG